MTRLLLVLLLTACPGPRHAESSTALSIIEASPDLDGQIVGHAAQPTVVIMMASWCGHCRAALAELDQLRLAHPNARILGVNYRGHEEYDNRGNARQLRAFIDQRVPWLRVVPASEQLFGALGSPPAIPTMWVYDARGGVALFYDPRRSPQPTTEQLDQLLTKLGA